MYAEGLCVHPHGLTSDSSHIWWRVPGGLQFLIHYTLTASLLKPVFCSLTLHATRNWYNPCSYEVGRYGNYHAGGQLSIARGWKLVHVQQTILGDSLQASQEIPGESAPPLSTVATYKKVYSCIGFFSFSILLFLAPHFYSSQDHSYGLLSRKLKSRSMVRVTQYILVNDKIGGDAETQSEGYSAPMKIGGSQRSHLEQAI